MAAKENKRKRMLRQILDTEIRRLHDLSTKSPMGLDMTEVKKLEALAKILQIENNYQGPLDEDEDKSPIKEASVDELIKALKK